jgi:hypothetical protein
MKTYAEAVEWIENKAKEYGGKNKFFSSEEYRNKYTEINDLYIKSLIDVSKRGKEAMTEVGAKEGQRVYYDKVGFWGEVEHQEGILKFDRNGVPKVKLDFGRTIKWHRGFRRLS